MKNLFEGSRVVLHYAGGEAACGLCPLSLLCALRRTFVEAKFEFRTCTNCQTVHFRTKGTDVLHLCSLLAEGVWSRMSDESRAAGTALREARVAGALHSLERGRMYFTSWRSRLCGGVRSSGGQDLTPCNKHFGQKALDLGCRYFEVRDEMWEQQDHVETASDVVLQRAKTLGVSIDDSSVRSLVTELCALEMRVAYLTKRVWRAQSECDHVSQKITELRHLLAQK